MNMKYETLRAKYGENPEKSVSSPELVADDTMQENAEVATSTSETYEANTSATLELETDDKEVTPEEKAERPAFEENVKLRELLNKQNDSMVELGQQMTRLEQRMAVLCNGIEQMRQNAKGDVAASALSTKLEELRQANARQEKANVDILRDSKNFQASVREQMQRELDRYHKMHAETANAPILTDIANLYIMSCKAISYLADEKERKNISEIVLEGLLEILEEQGVVVNSTPVGAKRSIKTCKTRKTILTGDVALHGTVAESITPSFTLGNQVLIKESIDTYVYDATLAASSEVSESETSEMTGGNAIKEADMDISEAMPVVEEPISGEAVPLEIEASAFDREEKVADEMLPSDIDTIGE